VSVTTICQVCESEVARHTCDGCGASVCPDHYESGSGLCAPCAGRAGRDGGGDDDVGYGSGGPGSDDVGPEGGGRYSR
jgi:hypothetical protein